MKAMLLAAGRGSRMRHLTDDMPKPLIQVGEHTLIEHNILRCKQAGIHDIVINVAYCAKQVIDALGDGERYGVNITYSYEQDGPIGTGAGIYQALPLLGDAPFLVLSSDIWTQFPLQTLLKQQPTRAHLVMVPNPAYNRDGDFGLSEQGLIHLATPKLTYANIAVIHPSLFKNQTAGSFPLAPLLIHEIQQQRVTGECYQGPWYNVGTPEELGKVAALLNGQVQQI